MDGQVPDFAHVDRSLQFIGVVRSEIGDRKAMPAFGTAAIVELFPEFADGLLHISKHTHFWVMGWLMGKPERNVLQVTPRGAQEGSLHGVFAVRSPARPNPIGLTASRLVRQDGLRLHFDCLDFLDGTPVLDLKPYFVSRDLIHAANNATIGRPRDEAALRESLQYQAGRYFLAEHPDVDTAINILHKYRQEHTALAEPSTWTIIAPQHRPYLIDALIGMTRVSFTRGLSLWNEEAVLVNGVRYPV